MAPLAIRVPAAAIIALLIFSHSLEQPLADRTRAQIAHVPSFDYREQIIP